MRARFNVPSFEEHLSKMRMSFHRKPGRDVGCRPIAILGCVLRTPLLSRGGEAATSREYREASLLERTGGWWSKHFLSRTTPAAPAMVASQLPWIAQPPLIVLKESLSWCVMSRRRACGKCGKAERQGSVFKTQWE